MRSPSEFAQDHVPGSINCPVLDDEERARVGTAYAQSSPFEAKKLGASLIARNIARHVESRFSVHGRDWRPLVYCWRGGKRSGALAHVLREIGWRAATLEGGYKAYRREVAARLGQAPRRFRYFVVCGATGCGKSRLIAALAARGAQALDLERIACHRGSVLGDLPGEPQPTQRRFDSLLWHAMRGLDPGRPVFVEAESKRIGRVQVPAAMLERMREGRCVRLEAPLKERVGFLLSEYRHFRDDPGALKASLDCLVALHGREVIERWKGLIDSRSWHALVADLLVNHYDPAYRRSTLRNYPGQHRAIALRLERLEPEAFESAAAELLGRIEGETAAA